MRLAVYPGSFDPVTLGHLDILERACAVFDRVVVGVLENPRKQALLAAPLRVELIRVAIAEEAPHLEPCVEVRLFDGLAVELCRSVGAGFLVRGLRAVSDFEVEMQLAHNNRILSPGVDSVFFMTSIEHGYVSSSLVKEIAAFGGDVSQMVPAATSAALESRRRT